MSHYVFSAILLMDPSPSGCCLCWTSGSLTRACFLTHPWCAFKLLVDHYSCFPSKACSCFPEIWYLVPQWKPEVCHGELAHYELNFSTLHQSYLLNLNLIHAEWNRTLEVCWERTQSSYTSQWLLNKPISLLMSLLNELLSHAIRWLEKKFFLKLQCGQGLRQTSCRQTSLRGIK